jgi:hypothetical protein
VKESKAGLSHSQIGNPCRSDSDCLSDGWETCDIKGNDDSGICLHKNLFPLKQKEFWGLIATIAVLTTVNIAGIGGGGTMVPTS